MITKNNFLHMAPIPCQLLGKEVILMPAVKESGLCEYVSPMVEFLIPVPSEGGRIIRVSGRFRLTPWGSKQWQME